MIILPRGIITYNLKGKRVWLWSFYKRYDWLCEARGFLFCFVFSRETNFGKLHRRSRHMFTVSRKLALSAWPELLPLRYFRFCSAKRVLCRTSLQTISFVTLCLNYKMPRPKPVSGVSLVNFKRHLIGVLQSRCEFEFLQAIDKCVVSSSLTNKKSFQLLTFIIMFLLLWNWTDFW